MNANERGSEETESQITILQITDKFNTGTKVGAFTMERPHGHHLHQMTELSPSDRTAGQPDSLARRSRSRHKHQHHRLLQPSGQRWLALS